MEKIKDDNSYYRQKLVNINRKVLEDQYYKQHTDNMATLKRYIDYAEAMTRRIKKL